VFHHKQGTARPGVRIDRPRIALKIFLWALLMRLLCTWIIFQVNPQWHTGLNADSRNYDRLAVNLWHYGIYSSQAAPPFTPAIARVPGYPAFLALVYRLLGHKPVLVVFWQQLLDATICTAVYQLGVNLTESRRIATIAALLMVLDLTGLLNAMDLMSETIFTLLLLLNMTALWEFRRQRRHRYLILAASWLGCAALVRPEAAGFGLVEAVLLLAWLGRPWRRTLLTAGAFLTILSLILMPWLARNWYQFHLLTLSPLVDRLLLYDSVVILEANRTGHTLEEVERGYNRNVQQYIQQSGMRERNPAAGFLAMKHLALPVLRRAWLESPWTQLRLHVSAGLAVWLPHLTLLAEQLGYPAMPVHLRMNTWLQQGWQGWWGLGLNYLSFMPWPVVVLCLLWLFLLLFIYAAALRGYLLLVQSRQLATLTFLIMPILFFAFATQMFLLAKTPRHRAPVMPYLALAAAIGLRSRPKVSTEDGNEHLNGCPAPRSSATT